MSLLPTSVGGLMLSCASISSKWICRPAHRAAAAQLCGVAQGSRYRSPSPEHSISEDFVRLSDNR